MTLSSEVLLHGISDIGGTGVFLHGHPREQYDRLRAEGPVHHVAQRLGGERCWPVIRYADVRAPNDRTGGETTAPHACNGFP